MSDGFAVATFLESLAIDYRECHAVVTLTVGSTVEQWPVLPYFDAFGPRYDFEAIDAEARKRIARLTARPS